MIELNKDEINCLIRCVVLDMSGIFEIDRKSSIAWIQDKINRLQFYLDIRKKIELDEKNKN